MGVCADSTGVEIKFYDKEGKKQIRKSVHGKGLLHSLPRTKRLDKTDPIADNYDLGSPDWLTDVMVADSEDELKEMEPSSTGASLTSTCSYKVRVQWKKKLESGEIDSGKEENCVTLAIVNPGEEDGNGRLPTKEICVFPEGTKIELGHPFWEKWHKTIDYLQSIHVEINPKP